MSDWDARAAARIDAWLALAPDARDASSPIPDPALPIEVQLAHDGAELERRAATSTNGDEIAAMLRKARELSLRLLVVLEQQGRPLAARHFAEQRARSPTRA